MKFKKKPIVVDAVRVESWDDLPQGVRPQYDVQEDVFTLGIETQHGTVRVEVGDWIVTEPDGQRYPIKHDVLMATYEPVKS